MCTVHIVCMVHNLVMPETPTALPTAAEELVALTRLEYELTLFSRHYLASAKYRPNQQLDRSAYLILVRLELDSPLSLKELAEAFRLDISTINRQVGAMRKQGLVERVADPDGGIARKVRATARGLEMLVADRTHSRSGVTKVLAEWQDDDIEKMASLIAKFNESIENLEGNPWPRPAG